MKLNPPIVKHVFIFIIFLTLGFEKTSYSLCPVPQKGPAPNIVEGDILSIIEPNAAYKIPVSNILIWVDKTDCFSKTNEKGYFFITDVQREEITLRIEYAGERSYLNLGKVGWGKKIKINGITITHQKAEYKTMEIVSYIENSENIVK